MAVDPKDPLADDPRTAEQREAASDHTGDLAERREGGAAETTEKEEPKAEE